MSAVTPATTRLVISPSRLASALAGTPLSPSLPYLRRQSSSAAIANRDVAIAQVEVIAKEQNSRNQTASTVRTEPNRSWPKAMKCT